MVGKNRNNGHIMSEEIDGLLRRADEAKMQSDGIDVNGAVAAALAAVSSGAAQALKQNAAAAEKARSKIHDQQERFKATVIAEGRSLDDELDEDERLDSKRAGADLAGNKYAVMMDKKKASQAQERLASQ